MMGQIFHQRERAVLHFNVADFAVMVERTCDAGLRQRPLVVAPLGVARALVYDMSEEAYAAGIRKGMALHRATRICREAMVLPPRVELYRRAMTAFAKELCSYSPLVETGIVDGHFFVDVTGTHRLYGPAPDVGWRIRREVRNRLGLNPIWALGSNKLIAKVASRLVKPVGEYIVSPGEEETFLAPLPVELLPGLLPLELRRMREFQVRHIGELAALSRQQLLVAFGGRSEILYHFCRGIDDDRVAAPQRAAEQLVGEHTFPEDTNSRREVEAVVLALTASVGGQLRQGRLTTRRLAISLYYSDGGELVRQATSRKGITAHGELQQFAMTALHRSWLRRTRIRSLRLICDRLQRSSPQLSLFAPPAVAQRSARLDAAMDLLRSRYGETAIGVAKQYLATPAMALCH
jgi:DNA polymerase-4